MRVEVIIPSLRQQGPELLAWSLVQQTRPPDVVTIVSNETAPFPIDEHVRLLRFWSQDYGVGDLDVALRQNIGIYESDADLLIIQGDDQIAPPSMVEDTLRVLDGRDYLWGNHHLVDWSAYTWEEIAALAPEAGTSRENGAPRRHGYQSCYGGMFAAKTEFLRTIGGFDMAFNGRHSSEDQALGYRLMRRAGVDWVWIDDPPFSFHPLELRDGDTRVRSPWLPPKLNGCGTHHHDFRPARLSGVDYLQCQRCPFWHFPDVAPLFRDKVLIAYDHSLVQTTSVWLG